MHYVPRCFSMTIVSGYGFPLMVTHQSVDHLLRLYLQLLRAEAEVQGGPLSLLLVLSSSPQLQPDKLISVVY